MANSLLAGTLAGMVPSSGGSVQTPGNTGKAQTPGTGVKGVGGSQRAPTPPQALTPTPAPAARRPMQQRPPHGAAPGQQPQRRPQFSANNPMMSVQPPPVPHPGLTPPYPDARSPQPTMMPNGQTIMPPPTGFIGAGMPPRVPATFIPGMTGLLARR